MRNTWILIGCVLLLSGCQTVARRAAPPDLVGRAAPDGFPADIRLMTIDVVNFTTLAPGFFGGLAGAATDGSIDILSLSGGGSGGAYGAGALAGLSRAHARPQFEMVTGVSAGALLAPFAFLGPDWDARMRQAFTGKRNANLLQSPTRTILARLFSPRGLPQHNPLFQLIDHFVTPQMVAAVADEAAKGRLLVVATTDLDKHETVLWDMGRIARHGGPEARRLFRDVLIASASVPGVFPPVLIRVSDGRHEYDEMHVDGGVTTPVFTLPLIAGIQSYELPQLRGAKLYMIVNGQLARAPRTTRFSTVEVLSNAFAAGTTYKTRRAIVQNIAAAHRLGMTFHMTEIPPDYPQESFIDFDQEYMQALFDYAAGCAARGLLWMTPEQSLRRNLSARWASAAASLACPAQVTRQ
ncbi:patatin-like phospholipase family protein [Frateuria hangzhouensis]|uniref:patatin-like phospholipase family protein n=1 Tax=Frateuria hangzhouensis TaxID=2995589 RepID=UPI00226086AE|nr:patatin-like phospholipase family protein [Frateuria sp. STR12]MCX7512273.1 patatin-like phospholipase family protein [Frateuria sp. STR12]